MWVFFFLKPILYSRNYLSYPVLYDGFKDYFPLNFSLNLSIFLSKIQLLMQWFYSVSSYFRTIFVFKTFCGRYCIVEFKTIVLLGKTYSFWKDFWNWGSHIAFGRIFGVRKIIQSWIRFVFILSYGFERQGPCRSWLKQI